MIGSMEQVECEKKRGTDRVWKEAWSRWSVKRNMEQTECEKKRGTDGMWRKL